MGKSQNLYKKAKKIIPGGTQLLSKRPEMFLPGLWPAYYDKAKGCEVWDLDGKKYIDMSYMGIGACILGYADADVNKSVSAVVANGSMCTLNAPEEVELAQLLIKIHPWSDMVRYTRTGGEAMAVAVRIARAYARKEKILFCGYHGWHDWYISANLSVNKALDGHLLPGLQPRGIPRCLRNTAIPFEYNDSKNFLKLVKRYKNEIAAVVMEPVRNHFPQEGFLETIREVTRKSGILLIFDEITSGWRLTVGGAHMKFRIYPDMAVFAKAMSNGYPMAAIIGREKVMKLAQDTFISSTYWTERIGPVAALATIKKLKAKKVCAYLTEIGKKIQYGWRTSSEKHNLDINISGIYPLSHFSFVHKPMVLKTLFAQLMLEKGFLATTAFYASYAHQDTHVSEYLKAVDESFSFISKAIKSRAKLENYLKGEVAHSGFKRLI